MSTLRSGAGTTVVLALVLASSARASAAGGGRDGVAVCRLQPRVLDVAAVAGPLLAHIELRPRAGRPPSAPEEIDAGVYIASVAGIPLAPPGGGAEGIEEDPAGRTVEDLIDVAGGAEIPNGVSELVAWFARPSDGNPDTRRDGDAGDLLAMLMDLPDGTEAEVCLAGTAGGHPFRCCDSVTVRNRGLRDLPRGLFPEAAASPR